MEWSGRVSKFWEYAGVAEQCPRFASPDRIIEVLAINAVLAKIRSSASQDHYFGGEIIPAETVAVFRNQSG